MKTIMLCARLSIFIFLFCFGTGISHAQFLKKLGQRAENAAENAVLRKSEQKVTRETEKAMDTILDGNKGTKQKKNTKSQKKQNDTDSSVESNDKETHNRTESNTNATKQNEFGVYSNFTFIPGNKLLFYDDFAADAIGDFPANWETGGSGEVVTTSDSESKWLSIVRRSGYMPSMDDKLPENYTIEFDLANNGYGAGKPISTAYTLIGILRYLIA